MVLGISSFTYGWSIGLNPAEGTLFMDEMGLLRIANETGISCVQIGDNMPLHKMTQDRLIGLKNTVSQKNIRLEIGARGLTPNHLNKYIELAAFFGSPILRFVIDDQDYTPHIDEILSIIREVAPELKKNNIILGIENHDRLKSRELAYIIETIDHDHVGICLDCVNSMGAGESLEYVLDHLAPYTINLHFKDFRVKRLHHKMGFIVEGAIPGQGFLNTNLVFTHLAKFNLCQSVILEQWVPPENDINDTLVKERTWAEKGIDYLKSLHYINQK